MLFSIWVLYTGYRYGWGPAQVGRSLMFVGVIFRPRGQAMLAKRVIARIGDVARRDLRPAPLGHRANCSMASRTEGWMI